MRLLPELHSIRSNCYFAQKLTWGSLHSGEELKCLFTLQSWTSLRQLTKFKMVVVIGLNYNNNNNNNNNNKEVSIVLGCGATFPLHVWTASLHRVMSSTGYASLIEYVALFWLVGFNSCNWRIMIGRPFLTFGLFIATMSGPYPGPLDFGEKNLRKRGMRDTSPTILSALSSQGIKCQTYDKSLNSSFSSDFTPPPPPFLPI